MAITLERLVATGLTVPDAQILFHPARTLIRGPSDTGKSYIRDCLWYLLGGDKHPKILPEDEGYASLALEFASGGSRYRIERALKGGGSAIFETHAATDGRPKEVRLEIDEGELLVKLSGAADRKILRSTSEKGSVTGGDLRHWFLLSQPKMISESPTADAGYDVTQRVAAFNLFLTGNDDDAVQVRKSAQEVERIKGQLTSAEEALVRARAGIPSQLTRKDVEDAFGRVDETLSAMNFQYQARSSQLKQIRARLVSVTEEFNKVESRRLHSESMVLRFELLDQKYQSDLQRLGAINEGVAVFEALPETDCPLCGTPVEQQLDPKQLRRDAPAKYRLAIAAEAGKILALRAGLAHSLESESSRLDGLQLESQEIRTVLGELETLEERQLSGARVEFAADPKTMAVRHSELSAQLASFDEVQRLENEIERLKKSKVRPRFGITRDGGAAGAAVGALARTFLNSWGFADVSSVTVDALACDLVINGRPRLSYGAGKRSVFLAALTLALLRHSMSTNSPHLGLVVLDSPLKAYADPSQASSQEVSIRTVTERFYSWLSTWETPGQIVILENEEIEEDTAVHIDPVQFSGRNTEGRAGFYPVSFTPRPLIAPSAQPAGNKKGE